MTPPSKLPEFYVEHHDGEWVGLARDYPSLSHIAESRSLAFEGIVHLVLSVEADVVLEERPVEET